VADCLSSKNRRQSKANISSEKEKSVERSLTFEDREGHRVSATLRSPGGTTDKAVVLCHGFMGFKDSWTNRSLSEGFARQGVATLRFDFFGHGQSGGELKDLLLSSLIHQTQRAIAFLREEDFTQIGVLGSSFGGLVALLTAAQTPSLAGLGLRCPVFDFPALLRERFGETAIALWRLLGRVPPAFAPIPLHYRFYEDCLQHDARLAAQALAVPTVIVHGEIDDVIPLIHIEELAQHIKAPKSLHIIPGADHRFSQPPDFRRMTDLLIGSFMAYLSAPVSPEP
jgi:pimeloyl-ACP methyl ester carboxylesterase